ncbi:MAG: diguanylate cyclase [Desulfobulbaceae bacterium]|nr:diguanylate cyclase [Desulfobulbaceae bacterium]
MFDHLQLLNHLSIGIAVIDPEIKVIFWNQWLAEHSMISSEAITGRDLLSVYPGLQKVKFLNKIRAVFDSGQPVFFNNKVAANPFPFYSGRSYIEKKLIPMEQTVIISPMNDPAGNIEHALITIFDISDWISNQKNLLDSKQLLERLSHTDELTQIPNRRNIMDRLTEELRTHNRKNRPIAIAMLDIDHFKKTNDAYGHQCGDMVLHETAQIMSTLLRDYDAIGRYGGEEFLIILPETTSEQSWTICNRIRLTVQNHTYRYNGHKLQITVSIGIAAKKAGESILPDRLIAEADRYLYVAKESGRNRTENKQSTMI